MNDARRLKTNLIDGPQNFIGAGLGADEHTRQAAAPQKLQVIVGAAKNEVGCGLYAPLELQHGRDESSRNVDAALTVDKKIVIDDIHQFETISADEFRYFSDNSV